MKDRQYPHTGWFVQSNEFNCRKEYEYSFADKDGYVFWQIKETRSNSEKMIGNLIYIALPYLVPVDVTERRNLVYNFKCLVSRNAKGTLKAGIYFNINKNGCDKLTVFYNECDVSKRDKINFDNLANNSVELSDNEYETLNKCCEYLQIPYEQLLKQLNTLYNIIKDETFIRQLLQINQNIYNMGME